MQSFEQHGKWTPPAQPHLWFLQASTKRGTSNALSFRRALTKSVRILVASLVAAVNAGSVSCLNENVVTFFFRHKLHDAKRSGDKSKVLHVLSSSPL